MNRTAINFLQTLSGVATTTRRYVDAVAGTGCLILETRNTLPGLRKAEKYAVSCGGGLNHRIGLYDAVLIKENHIHSAGSVCQALELANRAVDPGVLIEIEVEDLAQLGQAIECGAKRVVLVHHKRLGVQTTLGASVAGIFSAGEVQVTANFAEFDAVFQ